MVPLDSVDLLERQEPKAAPDLKDRREQEETLDHKDNQVHRVLRELRVRQEILVWQVLQALRDQQEPGVMPEHLEVLVHRVQEAIRDPKAILDSRVQLEILEMLELQELQD